jgi:NADPH-dependent 2,4-dienoyl-CoA reductase/sulfur reductase-like enzyme
VGAKTEPPKVAHLASPPAPQHIVIVGAGAAGHAAAEMLRRRGYVGQLTLVGGEDDPPYDRPNLSKDYLAGNATEEWIPLRPREFYVEQGIELELGTPVTAIDAAHKQIVFADGRTRAWDRLLLATGAEPVRLAIPGAELPHVHLLRSLQDSRAIIAKVPHTVRAVVIGSSFIGLEVAASLRARNVDVHLVAPEARPLERVMGAEVGDWLRGVHEGHGVVFHLGRKPTAIDAKKVTLDDGSEIVADLVVMGVGVRPRLALAETAGVKIDRGVIVDEQLMTTVPGIYAVGDIARFPWHGEQVRIEHWVVAQRMGQAAARNMLGAGERYEDVPFFWSMHYDVGINYVGHVEKWDRAVVEGSLAERSAKITYFVGERAGAVATVWRDADSLAAEVELART